MLRHEWRRRQADPREASSLQNLARVQGVAEAIAQVVDAEHGEEDGGAGEDGPMRREVEIVLGVVEDTAQVGMSGGKPSPRKDRVDSARMAAATSRVPATMTGPRALGRMWRIIWRKGFAPRLRAASTNSFSRRERNCARTSRATGIQRSPPMTTTIMMKMPASGPRAFFSTSRKR